jgi:adenylate cyclase
MFQFPFRKHNQSQADSSSAGFSIRRSNRRVRRLQVGLVIGVCVGLFLVALILLGELNRYEARSADLFYRPRAPSGQVVLILVDDKTVEEYNWPVERIFQSSFLFAVLRAQPRVVALDFVLPDPATPYEDELLSAVISHADKIVQPVLGIETTRYPADPMRFPAFDSVLRPTSALLTPNTTLTHAMLYADSDGVVRRVPLAIDTPGARYPALGLAALALYLGREPQIEIQDNQVVFGGKLVPLDETGQMLINYVDRGAFTTISYSDILQGKADYSLLRDKIVLVGLKTKAIHESYAVPLTISSSPSSNVEIQADLIETLLSGVFLRNQDRTSLLGEVLIVALIAGVTLPHLPWLYAAALVLIYFVLYLLYAFQRFDSGIVSTPLYVVLALGMTYALTMLYRYLSEERGRALVARAFLGIVSPDTVNQVLVQYERGALSLSGGRREATVLCIGLRELTGLSDVMAPEMLIELLNRYTARVFETVFRWDGSVNKAGNNIVAVWNLPLDHPDHARRAVLAAFDIVRAIESLQPTESTEQHVGVSLGIATGTAIAGRIGGAARADYTVIGEVVTVAERVSILAGDYQVLIDPAAYDQIRDEFDTREVHTIRVRGKRDPLVIREVLEKVQVNL